MIVLLTVFMALGCQKDSIAVSQKLEAREMDCGDRDSVPIFRGNKDDIGMVSGHVEIWHDQNNTYFQFFDENNIHVATNGSMYIGDCQQLIDDTKDWYNNAGGTGIPGHFQFDFKDMDPDGDFIYSLDDPLLCGCIAIHSAGEAGGWAGELGESGANWSRYFEYCAEPCEEYFCYQEETAWATGTKFVKKGNWATWTPYSGVAKSVDIYAGQTNYIGTVDFSAPVAGLVTISINLTGGWELVPGTESVKIQGYNATPPASNPSPGLFTSYKGSDLEVEVDAATKAYAIHLDVRHKVPCIQ